VNTHILQQELAPLNAQIERIRQKREALEGELRAVEAELETFSAERQRFDALKDVCNALGKLEELKADKLFWEAIPGVKDASGHMEFIRNQVARFEQEISGILEKEASLQGRINQCRDELGILYEEVNDAYDREEQRKEEFVMEREISPVPEYAAIMPWTNEAESERRFRKAVLSAIFFCFVFGIIIPMIKVPIQERMVAAIEIPKRLVELVRKEQIARAPKPKSVPKQEETKMAKEETKSEKKQTADKPVPVAEQAKKTEPGGGGGNTEMARKKAEGVGVLAFKDAFKDLMKETPAPRVGAEARLSKESPLVAGRAVAQRSLVSIQAQDGSSGGIGNAGVSRNVGNGNIDRLGGIGIGMGGGSGGGFGSGIGNGTGPGSGRVTSKIANLEESSRPLSDGVGAGRTDEEIQIVFDRYKASLYRIYNRELRKDPTLRGKILLRLSIETGGEVSMCKVESTDLASPELVAQIVERVKRFNFGLKEGVPKITILYPIDFLPGDLG
jgi:hypothetical protein